MGTATFWTFEPAINRGSAADTIPGEYVTGGAHTTTTTASNLTDGAAGAGSAISMAKGQRLRIRMDEAARLRFGGDTPTATAGIHIWPDETTDLECSKSGTVSIIDVA